jgi:hypothetical protein
VSIPTLEARRFTIGKYEIRARPIPHSAHMLRYTVFAGGKYIGSMASVPSESDCRFLENPPVTPPLVQFKYSHRPGRPKKGAPARTSPDAPPASRDELPHGMEFPQRSDER